MTDLKEKLKGKVLFFDIETSHNLVRTFPVGNNVNLTYDNIVRTEQIISIAYKDPGWKEAKVLKWERKGIDTDLASDIYMHLMDGKSPTSASLCRKAKELAEGAYFDDTSCIEKFIDIAKNYTCLVAHNGDRFDVGKINGRCLLSGLTPFTNVLTLDTLKMLKGVNIPSKRLDALAHFFNIQGKNPMRNSDWIGCEEGDSSSLDKMCKYNKQDVELLEDIFYKLVPYVNQKTWPVYLGNIITGDRDSCTTCGSYDIIKARSNWITKTGTKLKWLCRDCDNTWVETRKPTGKAVKKLLKERGK